MATPGMTGGGFNWQWQAEQDNKTMNGLFDDPGEIEGGFLGGLFRTGLDIGRSYLPGGTVKPSPQTPVAAAQPVSAQPGWVKWAIIGGAVVAVLAVLGLVLKKS